jgi:hypothetical protein
VHRLVATAFLDNLENKLTVNHIDHNPSNNMLENLEWATMREQLLHKKRQKTHKCTKEVFQIDLATNTVINKFRSCGYAAKSLGFVKFNKNASAIRSVCENKIKRAYGFGWAYNSSEDHDLPGEQWAEIAEHPGCYISTSGRFRKNKGIIKLGSLQKSSGYRHIEIKNKCYKVHRIVAQAFISNPQPDVLIFVNHLNGVKTDNSASNLEWVSPSANAQHAHDTGLIKRKKAIVMYDKAGKVLNIFDSQVKAAKAIGLTTSAVNFCVRGRTKSAGGYIFKYAEEPSATETTTNK